ncbi:hypothetical protein PTKIN_Ptkin13bG0238100 [Pterospermum kingtungense]
MDNIDIPTYFLCPISLEIMKDPVTTITGITYDRHNIEQWVKIGRKYSCPVTKQPLPPGSDFTPNHTLRRLIQAWCTENASLGVEQIPTPRPSVDRFYFRKLIKQLQHPDSIMEALRELDSLAAATNDRNRKYLVEAGIPEVMLSFIVHCFNEGCVNGLEEALSVLFSIRIPLAEEAKSFSKEHPQIINSLIWALGCEFETQITPKSHSVLILRTIIEKTNSVTLERLEPQFFETMVGVLKQGYDGVTERGINAALDVLLNACPWARNRLLMIELGAVSALIELELGSPQRRTTELILGTLVHLCSIPDGRAEFLSHKGGLAMVTRRIMSVSPAADDRALVILSLISKFCATISVLREMKEVGTVTKLSMLLDEGCASYLKEMAQDILKSHSDVWQKFPCNDETLLTRYII